MIAAGAVIGFASLVASEQRDAAGTQSLDVPSVTSYRVAGRDERGTYEGAIVLLAEDPAAASVRASRIVRYEDGLELRFSGSGTVTGNAVQLRLASLTERSQDEAMVQRLPLAEGVRENRQVRLTGQLEEGHRSGTALLYLPGEKTVSRGKEYWALERRGPLFERATTTAKVGTEWTPVPLAIEKPGAVRVTAPLGTGARGLFLPRGQEPPQLEKVEHDCIGCPMPPDGAAVGLPTSHTLLEGPSWLRRFDKEEAASDWVFWIRNVDRLRLEAVLLELDYLEFIRLLPFFFCDPWVDIRLSPSVVAIGEPVTITVDAHAKAGLDMYWWFGATGIASLDTAHIRAGLGLRSGTASWTVTIDQPGTHTFGANARDLLYWTDPGVPHQASESCGLAWDEVEVVNARKSYSVGFILLAPEGTDVTSPAFQGELAKIDTIKNELIGQFDRSTDGKGRVDVSYPTVVLMPPGPVYGLSDGNLMWQFLQGTTTNEFYASHPDSFDFLAIYEMYPGVSIGSRHVTVKPVVAGLGISPFDNTAAWGSAGRLRGVGLVTDVTGLPGSYEFKTSKMHLLLHEVFGHQWGVFAARLMKPGFHFDIGIESPTFTVLYGRPWRKTDNTHFTTADITDPVTGTTKVTFHPWMLYAAGMKLRSEVPETLMDVEPDTPPASRYDLVTTTGTFVNVTLQSIIDAEGDRYDVP